MPERAAGRLSGLPDPLVVALAGPTGVGKTGVAVELASLLATEGESAVAINCDSMQVYRGITVLSGGPTPSEERLLEHRLVGIVPIEEEYSVGEFTIQAHEEIDSLLADGRWPILVGGSGLYMRAALTELELRPRIPLGIEEAVAAELDELGSEELHRRLPEPYSDWVHPKDRKRVSRYLGLLRSGQEPAPPSSQGGGLWSASMRRHSLLFGLGCDQSELRSRIERRVDSMATSGAPSEAKRVLSGGASRTAAKAVGINEFAEGNLDAVVERHLALARRQGTWIRRDPNLIPIDRTGLEDGEVAKLILDAIEQADRGEA